MKNVIASPLFTIICATVAFILLVWGGQYDTTVPDTIATATQHREWVAEHGTDQSIYYKFVIGFLVSGILAVASYFYQKTV